jgi:hypothetical protein
MMPWACRRSSTRPASPSPPSTTTLAASAACCRRCQQFAPLIAALANAAAYQGDLTLNLQRITQTLFSYAQSHPFFYRMQLALWFAPRQSEAQGLVAAV